MGTRSMLSRVIEAAAFSAISIIVICAASSGDVDGLVVQLVEEGKNPLLITDVSPSELLSRLVLGRGRLFR